jgi:hypothetical protein
VALSAFWEDFVADYFADGVFWYFPKGGTADTDDFRERFRIFSEFEGEEWSPLLQGKFLDALCGPSRSARPGRTDMFNV